MQKPNLVVCDNDLPAGVTFPDGLVAVDTETDGLDVRAVNLWLVQVADSAGNVWLVQFDGKNYAAPHLRAVLENPRLTKLFHYARFDLAMLQRKLGIEIGPVFCSKIASKLVNPNWPKHNLRALAHAYCGIELDKTEQVSAWSARPLSAAQQAYAAADVVYLAQIFQALSTALTEKNLNHAMHQALQFLPTRVALDLAGFDEKTDVFSHA